MSVFNLIPIVLLAMETFLITVSTFVVTDLATGASSTTTSSLTSSTGSSSATTSSLTSSTGVSAAGADGAIASPPAHDCKTSSTVFPDASALASADL